MSNTYIPENRPTLEEAQAFVKGWVVMAVDQPEMQVLVDEDGLAKGLAVNHEASKIANMMLVGNAIILKGKAMWIDEDAEEDMIGEDAYE